MASNFLKAMNEANFSVTTSRNGSRQIGGNAAMDREERNQRSDDYRGGRSRGGRSRNRGGGGRYNNRRGGRSSRGGRFNEVTPYSRFQQEDSDGDHSMGGQSHFNSRYKPYGGGRQSHGRNYNNRESGGGNQSFDSNWFKISIPGGKNHERNWLTSKLKGLIDEPFEPVELHYMGDTACFFVDDKNVADKLKSKSHRITCQDGSKIAIHVRPSPPPRIMGKSGGPTSSAPPVSTKKLDPESEAVFMNCLAKRFDEKTNTVSLNKLMEDPILLENNIQGKAWLVPDLIEVISKVSEGLHGLDVSENRIRNLEILRTIPRKLPKLEILSIKDNEIQSLEELEKIKSIKSLKHLYISGNPVCNKYLSTPDSLLRDVRSKLDTVEMLDGVKLPPPILFDVPAVSSLPETKEHHVASPQMQETIVRFVQHMELGKYFQHYDQDDRQGLLDLYHDKGIFSMCVNTNIRDAKERHPLNEYFQISRNLMRLRDKARRSTLIKNTKLATVAFLNELPRTKHELETFAVDVTTESPSFVCFTVRGCFLEGDARDIPRAFSRTFILLKAADNSIKIINDQLHIRNSVVSSPKTVASAPASTISTPAANALSDKQIELVKAFCEQSKMNSKFSLQCLEQNNWDFMKAGEVFAGLKSEGKIPDEAFLP